VTSATLLGSDLLSAAQLSKEGIVEVLDVAEAFAEVSRRSMPRVPTLRGKLVATLFFEESTRTRLSFETAAKRLSADVASLSVSTSSVAKGESLLDTAKTVEALGADVLVVRHRSSGAPAQIANWLGHARVVNAGDGWHEHPSQALLDAFSVRAARCEAHGQPSEGSGASAFEGLRVLIVGDVRHSRVARSELILYRTLGASVTLCAPGTLLPRDAEIWDVAVTSDFDGALGEADVVSMLRLQTERGTGSHLPNLAEYTATFGLTERRAALLKPDAIVTHPGPMARGVEIASSVADSDRSIITRQVTNGVAVRMAILYLVLGGEPALTERS
jgi:aspartate carbamoyltransferase catalytic subunit